MALGMHSPKKMTTVQATMISASRRKKEINERAERSIDFSSSVQHMEASKTNTVRKKLKPTTLVPMNREGLSNRFDNKIPLLAPCFFFNSIFSRLAEVKATSIPAK